VSAGPSVIVTRGARHAEETVLQELERLLPGSDGTLAAPIRVVVPSGSLRQHLSARLAGRRPTLGVRVQTLRSLAAEVLERAGEPVPRAATLLEVLAAREAAGVPALAGALAGLEDGSGALAAAVRDLLDAGFGPPHLEAVSDRLAELEPRGGVAVARARAAAEVAARVGATLDELDAGGSALLWRRAASRLMASGESALPSRGVVIHGFANATGTAADLLEALVRRLGAKAVVDVPVDPVAAARPLGESFTRRLRERLGGARGEAVVPLGPAEPPRLRMLVADGLEGEVRAVAAEVLTFLERGATPERMAIAARQLAAFEAPLATHLDRLGIPFTVQGGQGLASAVRGQMLAFARLLERGARTPLDAWLRLRTDAGPADDVRVGLRVAGAMTLGDVATLRVEELLGSESALALPVRTHIETVREGDAPRLEARRRRLARHWLERAVEDARELCRALEAPPPREAGRQLAAVRDLAHQLGGSAAWAGAVGETLDELTATIPAGVELAWSELLLVLRRALPGAGREPLGGVGGGVQVLGVTQARGLTFDHLFVLGLNRDVFPRVVSEDPLLPDWVRRALLPVLPDLPVKADGQDEERYLFAHLLGAAPEVTLSWQGADEDGREVSPSPLVQRLLLAGVGEVAEQGREAVFGPRPATPLEHAVAAGLHGDRDLWQAVMVLAEPDKPDLAGIRRRILDEVDPDLHEARGRQLAAAPGPYLGAVGAVPPFGDREGHLFVTTLEAIAGCPWQTFLRRLLRLEHPPDPAQELGTLPPRLVGTVVHAVLADIAGETCRGVAWEQAIEGPAREVRWPARATLEAIAVAAAERIGRESGIASSGLRTALARRALPLLEMAQRLDFPNVRLGVLGAEVRGRVAVQDQEQRTRWLRFACDRLDRQPDGGLVATDYKTGKPDRPVRQERIKRRHLLQAIRRGEALQVPVYARAAGAGGAGRYLYLHPSAASESREVTVESGDEVAGTALGETLVVLLGMWDAGLFPPRLTEPSGAETFARCAWCDLAEACLQHDSGARARLARWASSDSSAGMLGAWWNLRAAKGDGGAET